MHGSANDALRQLDSDWLEAQERYKTTWWLGDSYRARYHPTRLHVAFFAVVPVIVAIAVIYVCLSTSSQFNLNDRARSFLLGLSAVGVLAGLWKAREDYQMIVAFEKDKAEYTADRAQILQHLKSGNVPEKFSEHLQVKTALNQLDAAWQEAQEDYTVPGKYGTRYRPTKSHAIFIGVVPTMAGIFITFLSISPSSRLEPDHVLRSIGPFLGIGLALACLWTARVHYRIAVAYEQAKADYHAERIRIRYQRSRGA
jgi:hypothetical protein